MKTIEQAVAEGMRFEDIQKGLRVGTIASPEYKSSKVQLAEYNARVVRENAAKALELLEQADALLVEMHSCMTDAQADALDYRIAQELDNAKGRVMRAVRHGLRRFVEALEGGRV
jgi:hypothetical protein